MIGLLGGSGNIGSNALKLLSKVLPNETIMIGSRNITNDKIPSDIKNAICEKVDIYSGDGLEKFFNSCDIVISCAGSSYKSTPILIDMAIKTNTHLVDTGLCNIDISKYPKVDKAIIYCAGSVPGISGMLPLVHSKDFGKIENIISIYEIKGTFSYTASKDYLNGIMNAKNDVMYIYRNKNSFFNINKAFRKVLIPTLLNTVKLFPYYDEEAKYIDNLLNCHDSEWYSAMSGDNMLKFFEKVSLKYKNDTESTINELVEVSKKDIQADREYVQYLVQLNGTDTDENPKVKTISLLAKSQPYLTGAVAVAQAISIYNGNVDSGVYPIYHSKYLDDIFNNLIRFNIFEDYNIYNLPINDIQQECFI